MADFQGFAQNATTSASHLLPEVDKVEGIKRGQDLLVPSGRLTLAV
jgi:hypothetical protein